MFKYFISLVLVFLCNFKNVEAQKYYLRPEFGFGGGVSHYYGDLNQLQGINMPYWNGTFFFKYNFNHYISLKATASMGKIGGDDKFSDNPFQKARNLNFESDIYETAIQSEFNFLEYIVGDFENRVTPYVCLGLGYFKYDPYTYYKDKKYYLKPIGTEGQNLDQYKDRRYSGYSVCMPIGLGIKYWMSRGMTASLEINNRITFTDYIDDVSTTYVGSNNFFSIKDPGFPSPDRELQDRSQEVGMNIGKPGFQRGINSTKDQYLFVQLCLGFRLSSYKCPDK